MLRLGINHNIDSDRLKRVNKYRQLQLQRWIFYEKENDKGPTNAKNHKKSDRTKRITFGDDVMLIEAVSRNDLKEVTDLLEDGVDPNSATIDGLTVLHQCCIDGFHEIAERLIKYNADVNSVDSEKWTPLHAAATCDDSQMCLLLSQYGSDFLALNADADMPYDICEGKSTLKVLEREMEKKGITQQQIDEARMAPEQKMLKDVKSLCRNKDNLDQLDCQGAALIHVACSLGFNEVVQCLLEAGADYSLPDTDGWLPIHIAACWSHVDIVEFLVGFGANIEVKNSNGDTVFDLCEAEFRVTLFDIRDNMSDIRRKYNINHLPQNRSFRRSRGSSVRRSSVRQKNMLSKKEAKEEFIALSQTISPRPDQMEETSDAEFIETHAVDKSRKGVNTSPMNENGLLIKESQQATEDVVISPTSREEDKAVHSEIHVNSQPNDNTPNKHRLAGSTTKERYGDTKENKKRPPRKWCLLV